MLAKKINEFRLDNYCGAVQDAYNDVLNHPESEYREEELDCLVDLVYREGFKDAMIFLNWLCV